MISALIWTRSHNEYESLLRNATSAEYDPTTHLYNGKTLIRKIGHAQARLKMRAEQGMLVAVVVTDLEALTGQIGSGGVHELLMRAGARVRRDAGLINPVGRYFDACFIVLIEAIIDREEVHRLVKTLRRSFDRPMDIRGLHGEPQSVTLKVGVGLAKLSHQSDISSVLQRAESAALASNTPSPPPSSLSPTEA
jgi:GGDEF domain-containing protein